MRRIALLAVMAAIIVPIASCTDADVASRNLSTAADQFQVPRRVVFYNSRVNDYMLTIEGLCSLGNNDTGNKISITCKTGPDEYKKHFLGLDRDVTYFIEQTEGAKVDTYHYRVVFKPSVIIPDIDLK